VPIHRNRTLRFRLTALATVVVAVVLALTAVVLLLVQHRQLTAGLDASLTQRADTLTAAFADGIEVAHVAGDTQDRAVQLVGPDGGVLARTANLAGVPPLPGPPDGTGQVIRTRRDLPLEDDAYRVLTRSVDTAAGPAVLHVAEASGDLGDAMGVLTVSLAVTLPAVVALLAAMIWWLTGRALGPVEAIRAEVESITTAGSGHRVPVPVREDEIGDLATTMNRMLDRISDADERQRRFVADAAHELRTPLTRIRTTVEVDLAHPSRSDPPATNRTIREEAVALQGLIDDLLFLARSDAGHRSDHRETVDLDDIVMAEIRRQRITTTMRIDATGLGAACVEADPGHLTRAVRNLLDNATRHARSTVTVTLTERDGGIELTVTDDGPGVPPPHRDRIFDRFTRVDDARTSDDGGTGLGLAITKDIVTNHGGTIGYDTMWEHGARFVVVLPAARAAR
jgi:signal transduction histidine kinase